MEIGFVMTRQITQVRRFSAMWFLIATFVAANAQAVYAGLIPTVDSATVRQGAAQLTVETLHLSARGAAGVVELEEAVVHFRDGQIDQALTRLEAAWEVNKRLPPPGVMLARMFLATGSIGAGRQMLEQAAVQHPEAADVYLALGDLALAEGRLTDASLQYEKASSVMAKISEDDAAKANDATSGLAAVAERRAQWDEAERLLTLCVENVPHDARYKQRLARTHFEQQRYPEAAKTLGEAEQLDEGMQPTALVMGRWHHAAGHAAEATSWMQTALEQSPDDPATRIAAALWNLETNRPREASQHIEHLAKTRPETPELVRLQGIVATFLEDFETAEHCFQSLVTENPADFAASNQLALALIEQESDSQHRRAAQLAELNTRHHPSSPDAYATLGWILYRRGQLEAAERVFEPLLTRGEFSQDSAYFAGCLLADRDRDEEAQTLLKRALESPGSFRNRQACQALLETLRETAAEPSAE